MKTIKSLCLLLFVLFFNFLSSQNPNVIVIIADDMGWSQVSTGLTNLNNQSDFYETPNLETLASQGIAFPYGYVNGANCAPTRAALLSGQYASRPHNNIWAVDNLNRGGNSTLLVGPSQGLPSGIDELPVSAITIAETMKTAGYATVHLGKFHVGENESTNVTNNAATDQGFDYNYGGGTKGAPGSYFASGSAPYIFHSNIGPELDVYASPYTAAESIALSVNGDTTLEGTPKHVTDAMADAAIDWMELNKSTPFFMHFSNFAIHGPFDTGNARPDLVTKYQAKTPSQMGHNNIGQAAIAEGMDQTIGRLIDYLKTTADPRNPGNMLSANTLVYFISDNGGAIGTDDNGPLRAMKGELYEGGIRSVTIAWSEASWLANKGTINTTPVMAFDLYPTLAEMAGASLPGGGYDIDGESQWQMLTNGTAMTRESLYWHFPGYLIDSKRDQRPVSVIRKGDYKLIHNYETASYELYDLVNDISEATNLLSGTPDQATLTIANDMSTDLQNHLINISAPLPTYRSNGQTVPLPYIINTGGGQNSTDGCQAISGYDAYWDFDIASDANDASGNGNDPNPINGTLTYDAVDFKEGDQSVVFDGTVDINYSSATFMSLATSARTVSAWVKPTTLSGIQEIFDEGGNTVGIAMRLNGSNLESVVRSSLTVADSLSTPFPNDGDWHHLALVYDGANTSHKLFIDGVEAVSSNTAPASIGSHNATGGGIGGVIGSWDSFSNAADSYFIGKMDAFAVYDAVLSDTQINDAACVALTNSTAGCQPTSGYEAFWDFDLANLSIGEDASGNLHNPIATVGSIATDTSDFKEGDQSAVFNGSSSIQYSPGSPGGFMESSLNARTMMTWVKPTNLSGLQNIFDEGGGTIGIAMRLNGNNLEAVVRDSGTTSVEISSVFPNDGDWHHVALIYDGINSNQKLYIDGVEVASGTAATSIGVHTGKGGIGGKISGSDSFKNSADAFFTGKMDAFAVYNTVLNATEINNSACVVPPPAVVADAGPDVTICEGDSTTLTASGGTTYLWSTGETTASINVSPIVTTTYTVTVSDGITSDNDDVIVTVTPSPTADAGADVTIDEGNSTTLTATGGGTYLWSTGETTANINVSPTATTTYTVTVTQNGCSSNDDVVVTVNPIGGCTYSVINSEGFESGWGIWNDGGSDSFRDSNAAYATTGTYSMRLRDNTSTSVGTTDNLDLTAYDEITVDFGYYCRSMDNSNEDFWLQISTNGGGSFITVEEWNRDDEFVNNQFYTDQVIIAGPFTATTQLRFRADASGNSDWVYIDDIVINGCSSGGTSKINVKKEELEVVNIEEDVAFDLSEIEVKLYPNPFREQLTIKIQADYNQSNVQVFNILGQLIIEKNYFKERLIKIPANKLESGQYLININVDGDIVRRRIVKH
ncbi:LamG-like jellyroll fold domain-containing protein [Flavivirga abyssicola]|uniref:LamG-like jellyroll fold domain-containing protein n=1 Tax=Flavivirga abyssicola TaxID=3063533 RepID=UPI0026DF023C|nr:LamG-like jellyroll fold domain-containing protein [Flavivirga sp. MEBiC07777]WVK13497.1 LamG-like jellyroll fold domain-containing protein [Flavivirga sp. MEBiC07777]